MTALDVDVFLQDEMEGEEDDQEQRQSMGADAEAGQVLLQNFTSTKFPIFLFVCCRQVV